MKRKVFVGDYLRDKRMEFGYTQAELAEKVNRQYGNHIVDATTISRWEISPDAVPRNNKLVKVAEVLGCKAADFFEILEEKGEEDKEAYCKILSLNVNRFCGMEDIRKLSEGKEEAAKMKLREKLIERTMEKNMPVNLPLISTYIKAFLSDYGTGLAILQDVPTSKYAEFKKVFEEYVLLEPVYMEEIPSVSTLTLGVMNQGGGWRRIRKEKSIFSGNRDYAERAAEITNGFVSVLGVHMPADSDMGKELWQLLLDELAQREKTLVIGDFNAHYNDGRTSEFRYMLDRLKKLGYVDIMSDDVMTFYPTMTATDHAFYSKDIYHGKMSCEIIPKLFSDHAVIVVDMVEQ